MFFYLKVIGKYLCLKQKLLLIPTLDAVSIGLKNMT